MEVIQYSDLFSPDIERGISALISHIEDVKTAMEKMVSDVQAKASVLGDALAGTSSSTKGGRDNTQQQAAQVEALYNSYTQLKEAAKVLTEQMASLSKAEENNNKVVKLLNTANDTFASTLDRVRAIAELASDAITRMGSGANSAELKQLQQVVKSLEGQVKNLEKSVASSNTAMGSTGKNASKSKTELMSYEEAFRTLSETIDITKINFDELQLTEKAHQKISKNGEIANNSLKGSYNQLSAQYNIINTVLSAMSDNMRKNTEVGKQMEAEAMRIRSEMKSLKEVIGDNTLSVGHYEKAMNGLNIASIQVLREMPTLANSMSQFFIAISNNVPIFVQNLRAAAKEAGGFAAALKGLITPAFAFEAVMLVILTILPKVAKAISDKRKAQKEANKVTEEAITLEEMLANVNRDLEKSVYQSSVKVETLTKALNDENRSLEERTAAARILKKEFADELAGFTEEEILAGKSQEALDKLTNSVKQQAEARAILNKMTEYYGKILDQEPKKIEAQAKLEEAQAKRTAAKIKLETATALTTTPTAGSDGFGAEVLIATIAFENAEKAVKSAEKAIEDIDAETGKYSKTIDNLYERLNISALEEKVKDGGRTVREEIMEIPSYYNEMLQALINNAEEGIAKELAQYDLNYKIQREKRQEQMDAMSEMLTKASEEEKAQIKTQMGWLATQMVIEEDTYYKTRERMWKEHLDAYKQIEVEEEEDMDEANAKFIRSRLEVERNWLDRRARMEYANDRKILMAREHSQWEEVALKEKLNEALLSNEKEFWESYLAELKAEGLEMTDEYNVVVDKIASLTQKATNQTSTHKKRGSANFRNITELAFAFSPTFGEKTGKGLFDVKIKDEYLDFANAVNNALQTSIDYMDEWMDKRIEMAEIAVEQAEKEADAAKTALDYEMEARANGYANNVELARKEYAEKLALQQQAIAEQKRLEKIQESINTAQQISSLVTATANLWSSFSSLGVVGPILAAAATALMFGSFIAAKVQAAQVANQTTYGEGMTEYLNYGGSHASGNDIDFGRDKNGHRRRVERGEVIGVVNKKNVNKYGANNVMNIIQTLNNGTFEKNYTANTDVIPATQLVKFVFGNDDFLDKRIEMSEIANEVADKEHYATRIAVKDQLTRAFLGGMGANYGGAFGGSADLSEIERGIRSMGAADLSEIEKGIKTLISQNTERVVQTKDGRIEYKGNTKRVIKES